MKSLPVLSYIRLPTIRAGKFVNPGLCEWSHWCVLCERRLRKVLFVRKATCMLECLNRSVMYLDSLPEYVNVDHFRSLSGVEGGWGAFGCGRGLGMNCYGECGGWCLILSGIHSCFSRW